MPKLILVVDDEPIVAEIAKRKLMERGYEVLTAADGQIALDLLVNHIPDLILLDVQMPNMNGYVFIQELLKNTAHIAIPVVVLTAYNEMEPLFQQHGVKSYLLKPLKLHDLINKVVEITGQP